MILFLQCNADFDLKGIFKPSRCVSHEKGIPVPLYSKKRVRGLYFEKCVRFNVICSLTGRLSSKWCNFEKSKKSLYICLRKLREHQCPRTSRLAEFPFRGPHKNTSKFRGVEEGKSKMINKWVSGIPISTSYGRRTRPRLCKIKMSTPSNKG